MCTSPEQTDLSVIFIVTPRLFRVATLLEKKRDNFSLPFTQRFSFTVAFQNEETFASTLSLGRKMWETTSIDLPLF